MLEFKLVKSLMNFEWIPMLSCDSSVVVFFSVDSMDICICSFYYHLLALDPRKCKEDREDQLVIVKLKLKVFGF